MPARAFVIRFPNGDFEYDVRRGAAPTVGETIRRRGMLWSVTRIAQGERPTVHVAHVEGPASKSRPGVVSGLGGVATDLR